MDRLVAFGSKLHYKPFVGIFGVDVGVVAAGRPRRPSRSNRTYLNPSTVWSVRTSSSSTGTSKPSVTWPRNCGPFRASRKSFCPVRKPPSADSGEVFAAQFRFCSSAMVGSDPAGSSATKLYVEPCRKASVAVRASGPTERIKQQDWANGSDESSRCWNSCKSVDQLLVRPSPGRIHQLAMGLPCRVGSSAANGLPDIPGIPARKSGGVVGLPIRRDRVAPWGQRPVRCRRRFGDRRGRRRLLAA